MKWLKTTLNDEDILFNLDNIKKIECYKCVNDTIIWVDSIKIIINTNKKCDNILNIVLDIILEISGIINEREFITFIEEKLEEN